MQAPAFDYWWNNQNSKYYRHRARDARPQQPRVHDHNPLVYWTCGLCGLDIDAGTTGGKTDTSKWRARKAHIDVAHPGMDYNEKCFDFKFTSCRLDAAARTVAQLAAKEKKLTDFIKNNKNIHDHRLSRPISKYTKKPSMANVFCNKCLYEGKVDNLPKRCQLPRKRAGMGRRITAAKRFKTADDVKSSLTEVDLI
eukprot:TRINITY_DN498_c0_g1_i6.p2 TRINITY_DN498_c0_g1~~TRINITY_DN498_c0_g1_i6.p2  ORF type:complete len:196 (+),score=29.49 TRINITY_DN498_c0_g1_i6:227-814(+)